MSGGGIRTLTTTLAHRPLQGPNAQRLLFVLGLMLDASIEKLNQGVHDTMPLQADASALPIIGQDRLMPQGVLGETDADYRLRLQRAFDDWQLAGGPWAVMRQVRGYLAIYLPDIACVHSEYNATGTLLADVWDYFFGGANTNYPPTHQRDNASPAWDWDSLSPTDGSWGWWRWWLIIYSVAPQEPFGSEGEWGTGTWGQTGGSWGLSCDPDMIGNLRQIISLWKAAHAWCHEIIISFSGTIFQPTDPSGGGVNPDGLFGHWSKIVNNVYVQSRFDTARYCTGV